MESQPVAASLNCNLGNLPFSYLGLTVGANMNRVCNWTPVIQAFDNRLSIWKSKSLSIGGRLTLLKSVLEAIPTYFFSLYKAPSAVIETLEAKRRRFLWGGSENNRNINWIAWKHVTSPKSSGGLGLSPLKDINLALLTKWWWRFKTEENALWRRLINAIHNTPRTWPILPHRKQLSGTWNTIARLGNYLSHNDLNLGCLIRGKVGTGASIRFWVDTWAADVPFKDLFPDLFVLESCKSIFVSECYVVQGNHIEWQWRWKRQTLQPLEFQQLQACQSLLLQVTISNVRDKWNWCKDTKGIFSVASMRQVLQAPTDPNLFRFMWNNWVPIKVNVFGWRAERNRIATRTALAVRGVHVETQTCPLCNEYAEDAEHLLTSCFIVNMVWNFISSWCNIPPIYAFNVKDILQAHIGIDTSNHRKKIIQAIILTACWCLWKARNEKIFEEKPVILAKIFHDIKINGFMWIKYRSHFKNIRWIDWCNMSL